MRLPHPPKKKKKKPLTFQIGVEVIIGDLGDDETAKKAYTGVHTVISTVGDNANSGV